MSEAEEGNNIVPPSADPGERPTICFDHTTLILAGGQVVSLEAVIDDLQVGDVILCSMHSKWGDKTAWWVCALQAPDLFHERHRKYTHVALYIGRGKVVEKQSDPVWRQSTLRKMAVGCDLLVRRYKRRPITDAEKAMLLSHAIELLDKPYSRRKIARFAVRAILGLLRRRYRRFVQWISRGRLDVFQPTERSELIGIGRVCTDLIEETYKNSIEDSVVPPEVWHMMDYMLTPAALSWSPSLRDVEVSHRVIRGGDDDAAESVAACS